LLLKVKAPIFLFFFLLINSIHFASYAKDKNQLFLGNDFQVDCHYSYKKTLDKRSSLLATFEKVSGNFFKITEIGSGDYDKYKNITWESLVNVENVEGFLKIIDSARTIKDNDGNIVIARKKEFDYIKNKIYYTATDGDGKIIKKKTFPIKGVVTDNIALIYFLNGFIENIESGDEFYLITNEPRLYKVDIKLMEQEVLNLGNSEIETIRLRLVPDFGLFTGVTSALVPPTFVWYELDKPHRWVKYQGLESGIGSTHVISYADEYKLEY